MLLTKSWKSPEDSLFWVRKCEFFSPGRAWCMTAAAHGTICYKVFVGLIFSLWNQGKYKKNQGAANNCLVGMHASLWFCHSHCGCLVIESPVVFFLFGATTPLSRKAGTCTEVQSPHCWQDTTAREAPYFMQQKCKDLQKKRVMASQYSQTFTRYFLYL